MVDHKTGGDAMACFKCGQSGHVAAGCPQPARFTLAAPLFQQRPRRVCWSCGKRGHLARDCRSRPQGNGKGRGILLP
uniref:Uncharacterized protein n=1 Tax=Geospiza parvula TaxID=87175 RepID=A0A8U8B298_GEOPR